MSIFTSIVILVILMLVVEVCSIALKLTGLDIKKARFQVISIITNTGFTTKESELIAQHSARRKIAQVLMLLSYVGYAALIGLIVNIVQSKHELIYFIIIGVTLTLMILFFIRNKSLFLRLEKFIEKLLIKRMSKKKKYRTVEDVLKLNDEFGVVEFIIEEDSTLEGIALMDADLTNKSIQVLNVDRGSHIVHFPRRDLIFKEGDRVTVYGKLENINKLVMKQYTEEE